MELPWQIEPLPVIVQFGITSSVSLQLLVQPSPLVTVTEKVPADESVMHCVVAPVFQR